MVILDARRAVASKGPGTPFALRFGVDFEALPSGPAYLVVESPERFKVTVNGRPVSTHDCGWWVDISFRKLDLAHTLQVGHNDIVLEGVFRPDSELESIYLVGNFGVKAKRMAFENRCAGQVFDRYGATFSLGALPKSVTPAPRQDGIAIDLTASGLPFLAGRARLAQTVTLPAIAGRASLEFGGLRAAVAVVWVNGKKVGACAWQPHRVALGSSLHPGENWIEIELAPTLRNLLGPHHRAGGDPESTGPSDFNDKNSLDGMISSWSPWGLMR